MPDGKATDRGTRISSIGLCEESCDKQAACNFYIYNGIWCYLWSGDTCTSVDYGSYKVYRKKRSSNIITDSLNFLLKVRSRKLYCQHQKIVY